MPKNRKLTKKQEAFVKELLDNPKQPASKAVTKAYSEPGKPPVVGNVAKTLAYENLKKPAIISKLQDYTDLVESALVGTVEDWSKEDWAKLEETELEAPISINGKLYGRSRQRFLDKFQSAENYFDWWVSGGKFDGEDSDQMCVYEEMMQNT